MADIADFIHRSFSSKKVGIQEFSESSDYCDKQLYPLQRVLLKLIFLEEMTGEEEDYLTWMIKGGRGDVQLSPNIRAKRDYCLERNYPHFTEVDLIGGRRAGKGHVTSLATAKKIYDIKQIPDPGSFFNIDVDKEIYFANIASSLKVAKERQFADNYSVITRCAPLAVDIPAGKALEESISIRTDSDDANIRRMEQMGLKVSRDFSKLRVVPLAANAQTVRGLAMAVICFDEMAHIMAGESKSSASEIYAAAEPSLKQFRTNTLIFCNSSPYTKVGQFYDQVQFAMRDIDDPDEWYPMRMALKWASWAMYDFWWRDYRFSQAIMVSPDWQDQLESKEPASKLTESDKEARHAERLTEKANPEKYRVEYRAEWAEVVDAYLNPLMVDRAFTGKLPDGRKIQRTKGGEWPHDYKAHCDPSSTTAGFGFALGHVEFFPNEDFPNGAPHVIFDRIHRWNPKDFAEQTINYLKVRQDLEWLIKVYRPSELSFDQFQSTGFTQELREFCRREGIQDTRVPVITATARINWDRWETFKTALNLGLIHFPNDCVDDYGFDCSAWAALELKFLQEKPAGQFKKIEKQDLGPVQTKDIADCLAEVSCKFLQSYLGDFRGQALGERLVAGAEQGFQIGGRHPGGPANHDGVGGGSGRSALNQFYSQRRTGGTNLTRGVFRKNSRGR